MTLEKTILRQLSGESGWVVVICNDAVMRGASCFSAGRMNIEKLLARGHLK